MQIKEVKLKGAKIVEYEPRYAAGIAKMWNESSEGWNGEEWDMTEEKVLNEESCEDYIALYLVVNDEEDVLGYCKIEEYNDAKSVYIPLLNVHPKSHGKKYGKALLHKALKTVTEAGYERLDLHSWAGNTKAVPLYKKMGFRWQTNRRGVYMMNYLPKLFNLGVLKPYFDEIDWYHDAVCDLSLEPDSVMDKGFETLKYRFEKNGRFIEAVFNIEAKGMHRIACNDFEIYVTAENKDIYYGKRDIELIMNSNIGKIEAEINLTGSGSIKAENSTKVNCEDRTITKFNINVLDDKLDDKKDELKLDVSLNGSVIPLKLGVNPKAPVEISLKAEEKIYRSGDVFVYLQAANNLEDSVKISAELRSLPELKFLEPKICCELQGKEKKVLPLKCHIQKGLYYDEKVEVIVEALNEKIVYNQRLRCMLPDKDTIIFGEKKNSWFIHKDNIHLKYGKDRTFAPCFLEIEDANFWFFYRNPKLSEPFAKEFNNQKPEKVEFERVGNDVLLKACFTSRNKKIKIYHHLLFQHDNSLESKWEICNNSNDLINIDKVESCFDMAATCGGYAGNIIEMTQRERNNCWLNLDEEKKMNGWDYFQGNGINAAFVWDDKLKHSSGEYWQRIFYDFGELAAGESRFIGHEELLLNKFSDWKQFYSWYYGNDNFPSVKKLQQITLNDGNPFADEKLSLKYEDISHKAGKKNLKIYTDKGLIEEVDYVPGEILREIPYSQKIRIVSASESVETELSQRLFKKSKPVASYIQTTQEKHDVNILESNILEARSSSEFLNGIFSLKYKGLEIFSTSFPKAVPKGWDNNWRGGLTTKPLDISATVIDKHNHDMENVSRKDNYGNIWQGFAFSCRYNDEVPYYDGVCVRYNYLLSPSHDLIAVFPEIVCSGGKFIPHLRFHTSFHLNEKNRMNFHTGNAILRISDKMAGMSEMTVSHVELVEEQQFINCIADTGELHVSLQCKMGAVIALQQIRKIHPNQSAAAAPFIIAFTKEKLSEEELKPLNNLRWR